MKTLMFLVGLLIGLPGVFAQTAADPFSIAGGGGAKNGSTYSAMLGDFAAVCSTDEMALQERTTNGGPANLALLLGNKVKAAVVPSDLLFAAKLENASAVAQVKTLFALHPEPVHLIVRSDVKAEGGWTVPGTSMNLGGDKVTFNRAEDLKGRPVGAVGGSVVSARILSEQLRYGWVVTEYPETVKLLDALKTGQIDAVVVVAGYPSAAVEKLTGQFKLLALRGNADTQVIYEASKVQYPNLNQNKAVDTLAAPALVVTRQWRSDDMIAKLATLRACFYNQLPVLQDKEGTHAAWQAVIADNPGKWPLYELPRAVAPAALAPAVVLPGKAAASRTVGR